MSPTDHYEAVSRFAQQGGSVYFLLLFAAVCAYAFWPRNKAQFDKAARSPLEDGAPLDDEEDPA